MIASKGLTREQQADACRLLARLERGNASKKAFLFTDVFTKEQRKLCIRKLRADLAARYRPHFQLHYSLMQREGIAIAAH